MTTAYSLLYAKDVPKLLPHRCPWLTRPNLIGVAAVTLLCCVLILFSYFSHSYTAADCCPRYNPDQSTNETTRIERIRFKHTNRYLPQCLIIGVRKGGTRALIEFLNLHSSVQAHRSEVHFFDDDELYRHGLDWYRRKMPYSYPGQITIEKTPAYFTTESVPARVRGMNESVKLLLIVREPVERTISDFVQVQNNKISRGKALMNFESKVLDEQGRVNLSYRAIKRSIYHRHMSNWLRHFPISQFHVINGDKLVKTPWTELERVETFLGIGHKLTQNKFFFNASRGFYCINTDIGPRCLAPSKGRAHPSINPLVMRVLKEFFRPLNQKFYQLVGQDFGW